MVLIFWKYKYIEYEQVSVLNSKPGRPVYTFSKVYFRLLYKKSVLKFATIFVMLIRYEMT